MRKVEHGASIVTLCLSLWIATSHTATISSFAIRFSDTCKGFQILEDTNIKCILCSTMCLVQLKFEERFQPESHGVLVRNSDKQCTQIRIETDQVFCFESDFVDEETMTFVDTDRVTSISQHKEPYVTLYVEETLKFAPINDTLNSLPELVAPPPPIPLGHANLFAFFNRGFIVCTGTANKCFNWPFREEMWHTFPTPSKHHASGGLGLMGNQLIIVGGRNTDKQPTDICELFDPKTYSWSDGPTLPLALGLITLVQASSNTIITVGGLSNKIEDKTFLLSNGDDQWTKLEDRPEPVYHSCCGVVVLGDGRRGALSIGGDAQGMSSQAYFLDFELMTWSHMPSFTLPTPSFKGFLLQKDREIHFMPSYQIDFQTRVLKLYVRKTHGVGQAWESRPYPFGNFHTLNVGNPMSPTIYTIPIK